LVKRILKWVDSTVFPLFRSDARYHWFAKVVLASVLFVLLFGAYIHESHRREELAAVNSEYESEAKMMPTPGKILEAFKRVAFEDDRRTGEKVLWTDTLASGKRFLIAMVFIFGGILLGLYMGVFPWMESLFYFFMIFFDKINPLPAVVLLFILFGTGEEAKIAVMVIATLPTVCLDVYNRVKSIPSQLLDKARTFDASQNEIALRVALPAVLPHALNTIRLNLKMVVSLLLAAEMISADVGLGYRIKLVQRFMGVDIILVYLLWIVVLFAIIDLGLGLFIRRRFRWLNQKP
jgi:NitT/TauT family transport system permease protein